MVRTLNELLEEANITPDLWAEICHWIVNKMEVTEKKAREEERKKVDKVWFMITKMIGKQKDKECDMQQVKAELEIVFKNYFPNVKPNLHLKKGEK